MLVPTLELLQRARRGHYGVLACNVIGLEHAEAIVTAAAHERAPVILQVSQNAIIYRQSLAAPLLAACRELAVCAETPVGLHLDHATTVELCEEAVAAGVTSIMFDTGNAHDVAGVRAVVEWAHARGISVEGEAGFVGGKARTHSREDDFTDPEEAAAYVTATGVDSLAISVGSEHGMRRTTALDLARIAAIRSLVDVPLVLHGSSGVPDAELAAAIERGITKVNLATQLNAAFTGAVRAYLAGDAAVTDPRRYGAEGRAAMVAVVRVKCRLVGASGEAATTRDGASIR